MNSCCVYYEALCLTCSEFDFLIICKSESKFREESTQYATQIDIVFAV